MMANNETGVLQPVEEIGKIAAEAVFSSTPTRCRQQRRFRSTCARIGCHVLSISGHKIHAPQGVGALYVRKGTRSAAALLRGASRAPRRAGTENVPGIVALGKAAQLAKESLDRGEGEKMSAMRDWLERGILAQIEDAGVNGKGAARVPNTTNIHFDHIEGESLVIALRSEGTGGFDGRGLLVGSDRAFARADRDGIAARASAFEHSLQPGQADDRRRHRFCFGTGAGDGGAAQGAIAVVQTASRQHLVQILRTATKARVVVEERLFKAAHKIK